MNEERIRVRLPRLLKKEIESGGALKEAGRLRPLRLELELNMAPLSTAKMTLAENDLPVAMHDLIELYNQHGSAGVYRVTNIQTTYRREREIELKHAIDILHDTVYPGDPAGDEEFDGTVAAFLAKMFTVQSQKMNNVPFWQLGTCEDTGHWNRKIAYDNLYDLITEVSREHEDYLFTFDFSTFPWTVNFVEKNNEVLSEFRLRRNMSSCEVSLDDADLCTRLYLSVTTEEPDNGQSGTSTGKKTTETFATYDDAYSQAIWGVVEKSAGIKASDYPDTAAWVEDYFRRHATPTVQITIDGVELSELTGESIDEMHLGRICRVALPEYGTTFLERIVSVSYPDVLRTPTRVTVSLANKRESAEDSIAGITKQTESAAAAGRGMAGQIADAEEEIRQYRTWQTKTDKKIGDYAEIMGVTIDPTTGDVVYETDEQGNIKLDEDGNPIPVFDPTSQYSLYAKHEVTAQRIVNYVGLTGIRFDAQGNPIYKQAKDAQGNPIYDAQGNPVYETDSQGNPIPDLDAADGHSMYSQISQSIDSIDSVVSGHTDDISRIEQKADRIISEVTAARGGETTLSSRITQLATEITSKVSQTDLNTTLNGYVTTTAFGTTIGAVKDEDGNITAASITAAINDEGSAAYINADHVYVTGTTLLSGQVTVNDGMFYVLTSLGVGNAAGGGDIVSINNGKVSASTYDVKISGKVNFVVDNKTHYELTAAKVKNLVTGFGTTARVGQTISIPYSTISSPEINASSPKIDLTVPDAIATITVDDNPPEGKIGFKYTTLSNSQPVAVNFKIADTAYYKSHVGIKTTGSWQWDDEEEKYYRTIAPNDGQSETIDLPTFTTSVGTFNDQHKATILFKGPNNHTVASAIADASGLYSEAQNSVNVSGPTWSAVDSSNPYTRTATFRPSIGTGRTADQRFGRIQRFGYNRSRSYQSH